MQIPQEFVKPKNPVLQGRCGSARGAEWVAWSMCRYYAEFVVFDPAGAKPVITGKGEGATAHRALFAAAAECVDMGADRSLAAQGLSAALTGEGVAQAQTAMRVRTQNRGRASKLKGSKES